MESYRKVLELGRTEFSYEQANNWCKDFINIMYVGDPNFYFFFCYNKNELYTTNKCEYEAYAANLRIEPFDFSSSFPKELPFPKELIDSISSLIKEKYKFYIDYVNNNYSIIKYAFPSYNKQIKIYISLMYDNHYEFLLNMYDSQSYGVQIYPNDVVFLYRFANVEAMLDKIPYGLYGGFSYPDCKGLDFLFSVSSIHYDLNRLFVRYASFEDLRDYLIYMLRGELKNVSILSDSVIEIEKEKCYLCFDQVLSVDDVHCFINKTNNHIKYIAFRSSPDESIREILHNVNIAVITVREKGSNLISHQNGEMIHWFIQSRLSNLQIDDSYKELPEGDILIKKLNECPKGKEGWKMYEDIGGEIFNFLFADTFRNYTFEYQSTTTDGIFRRDMVVNNTYKESPCFWQLVKDDYNSNLIIIDFKNYQHQLNQDEFYNPSKYMNKLSGNFGIILSRDGLNDSAKKFQMKLLEENKLLLCLSDANLIDLINQKTNGQNPLYSLENLYYSLCKSK